jgi:ABC-type transporter lipoprotein component MlaA
LNQPLNIANSIFLPHKNVTIKKTSHFLTNTLLGFGGFFDVYSNYSQPTPSLSVEDIAQYYFEKPLPYLVLPMGFGNVFSAVSWFERQQMLSIVQGNEVWKNAMIGYTVGGIVVSINQNKEQIEHTLNSSIDSYAILRNVYYQSQIGNLQSLKVKERPQAYSSLISHEFI